MRTYLRLLLKPRRYLIGGNEADILETFLKKKWSPETISSVCFDKKISHQTIYNYIERERQLGGTLYRYLFFKKRRKKYGIKDYRWQIRNRVSIESRPEIVAERSRCWDWEGGFDKWVKSQGCDTDAGRTAKQVSMCNLLVREGCGSYEKWRNKVIARNECENDNL